MTTYLDRLESIGACSDALTWCREHHPTDLRAAWDDCPDGRWMLWLLVRLDRRRGVGVLVEVVRALCAHLAPDEVTTDVLNPLAAWAAGDDTIDVQAVQERAWEIRCNAAAAAAYAAYAAAAHADAADAAAYAAHADAAAAHAAAYAAHADAADAADMIRDLVPAAEVAKMLMKGAP